MTPSILIVVQAPAETSSIAHASLWVWWCLGDLDLLDELCPESSTLVSPDHNTLCHLVWCDCMNVLAMFRFILVSFLFFPFPFFFFFYITTYMQLVLFEAQKLRKKKLITLISSYPVILYMTSN